MWSPQALVAWSIGFADTPVTPHLQVAVCTASILADGTLHYDSGVRDFGTRLQVDVNWKADPAGGALIPIWEFNATVNKALRLPVLNYKYDGGLIVMFGDDPPGRNVEWQIEMVGTNIPACWLHPDTVVSLDSAIALPPFDTQEGFRLKDWCE